MRYSTTNALVLRYITVLNVCCCVCAFLSHNSFINFCTRVTTRATTTVRYPNIQNLHPGSCIKTVARTQTVVCDDNIFLVSACSCSLTVRMCSQKSRAQHTSLRQPTRITGRVICCVRVSIHAQNIAPYTSLVLQVLVAPDRYSNLHASGVEYKLTPFWALS